VITLLLNQGTGSFRHGSDESRSTAYTSKQTPWDKYSKVYDLMASVPFVKELRERHISAMEGLDIILDAGCGTGLITEELAILNHDLVIGIDSNPDMLTLAENRLKDYANTKLQQGDIGSLGLEDVSVDGYVSNNVLYIVEDPAKAFSEMVRVTRPGGVISVASARSGFDMDVLDKGMVSYYHSQHADAETMNQITRFMEAARAPLQYAKNFYEPEEISRILVQDYGCQSILEERVVYLNQGFFVAARR